MLKTCQYGVYNSQTDEVEPCGNLVEGNTDMCASHNSFFRKLEKQNKKADEKRAAMIQKQKQKSKQPRQKISKVSDKRAEINKEYFKLVEQFKHDNPHCAAKINIYCTGTTDDPHHSKGRGKFLMDVTTWVPVCRSCHIFITNNPQIAMDKGLSFSRLKTTEPHKI